MEQNVYLSRRPDLDVGPLSLPLKVGSRERRPTVTEDGPLTRGRSFEGRKDPVLLNRV